MSVNQQTNSCLVSSLAHRQDKEDPLQPKAPVLYASHRAIQHPRLMFYQPSVPTKQAGIALLSNLRGRCKLYCYFISLTCSVAVSFLLASVCIACAIVSLPLMITTGIGFFGTLLAEAIALFSGLASYAIQHKMMDEIKAKGEGRKDEGRGTSMN